MTSPILTASGGASDALGAFGAVPMYEAMVPRNLGGGRLAGSHVERTPANRFARVVGRVSIEGPSRSVEGSCRRGSRSAIVTETTLVGPRAACYLGLCGRPPRRPVHRRRAGARSRRVSV